MKLIDKGRRNFLGFVKKKFKINKEKCSQDENFNQNKEKYENLLEKINKLLKFEPDNATALNNRGIVYYNMGKYCESLADLTKSLEIEPNDIITLTSRGKIYLMM